MDRSPFDIETLARIANDLFQGGAVPEPGPTEVPSTMQAAAPAVDQGLEASAPHGFGVPAGGATFAPQAPPTRPAFGRAVSAEAPVAGYGSGQPATGTAPVFEALAGLAGFDPRVLPGFAPIPNIEDGFAELGRLVDAPQGASPSVLSFGVPPFGLPSSDLAELPAFAQAAPDFGPGLPGFAPNAAAPSLGGAATSPPTPPSHPAFGRPVSAEAPVVGYGTGQPRTGTTPTPRSPHVPSLPQAPSFGPQDVLGHTIPGADFCR